MSIFNNQTILGFQFAALLWDQTNSGTPELCGIILPQPGLAHDGFIMKICYTGTEKTQEGEQGRKQSFGISPEHQGRSQESSQPSLGEGQSLLQHSEGRDFGAEQGRRCTHSSTSSLPSPNFVSSPLRQNVYKIKSSALRSTRATQPLPEVTEFHNRHLPALSKTKNNSLH